jgi:hypothetical protein
MFPNNYSFNPGVVLDPVTMTPMISNGGAITVNPIGVPSKKKYMFWTFLSRHFIILIFFNILARP